VLRALEMQNIQNLIIFSDAPKTSEDMKGVRQTRLLLENIRWTQPDIIYQQENQGLARSIVAAANYAIQRHDSFILLEDDCVPQPHFYDWFRTCLERYREVPKVFGISGYSIPIPEEIRASYPYDAYFFPRMGSWGWATWKDRWLKDNRNLAELTMKAIDQGVDLEQGGKDIPISISSILLGDLQDTWTVPWLVNVYLNRGCYVYPTVSHIDNIGLDGTGVHCRKMDGYNTTLSTTRSVRFPDSPVFEDRICAGFLACFDAIHDIDATTLFALAKYSLLHGLKASALQQPAPGSSRPVALKPGYGKNLTPDLLNYDFATGRTEVHQAARPLKVVHLATTDFGGAGKAAYRLHQGLRESGIDSTMLVVTRKSADPSVRVLPSGQVGELAYCPEEFPANRSYAQRVTEHWTALVSNYPERDPGIDYFSDDFSEVPLENVQEIREADIVNLHWVSGLLNCVNAVRALRGKKVVWTMHDMNPVTGGCHCAGGCTGYLRNCGGCPMLGSMDEEDISRSIWQFKQYAYGKLDLHPVAPSRWLARVASKSTLFSRFEARVIPNGFPANVFAPDPERRELRERYGIPVEAKVVLFGADNLLLERKGFAYLLQALKGMATEGIVLAYFGSMAQEARLQLDLPHLNLGFIAETKTLAAHYSMADLFVITSLEDNLPNTVAEAMLCGVPVLGFEVGGIPDMVEHKKTGYLVPPRDVAALMDGINWCLFHPDAAGMGLRSREKALASYSLEVQAASYTSLYRELLAPQLEQNTARAETVNTGRKAELAGAATVKTEPKATLTLTVAVKTAPPRISLVIPSYNYGQYLEACLDSILSQGYRNLELIVMDGGSTDNSPAIIQSYQKHLSYSQSRPDAGQYSAIEEGLKRSSGEIMGWLNADDMFHPGAFAVASEIFSASPEVEWLTGRPNSFDERGGQKVVLSFLPMTSRAKYLADQELIQQEGIFWRRALWERSGGYLERNLQLAADLELWARFLRSARLFCVDRLMAGFRDHPLQKSKDKAGYTAEANLVLERERRIFAGEANPFSPPAPLPILVPAGVAP
jgi:glycosyltransferase involved in cell wall biosynthesis/GT2 family glycosyltransferase